MKAPGTSPHSPPAAGLAFPPPKAQTEETAVGGRWDGADPAPPVTQDTVTPRNRWSAESQSLRGGRSPSRAGTISDAGIAVMRSLSLCWTPCDKGSLTSLTGQGAAHLTHWTILHLPQ